MKIMYGYIRFQTHGLSQAIPTQMVCYY